MPDKQLIACGVITPTESRTSRVTENGWVVHERDTVPVQHTVHAAKSRFLERACVVFAYVAVVGWIVTMGAEIVRLCWERAGL